MAIDTLQVKENGNWTNIDRIYKRVSGNWVEQKNVELDNLFNSNIRYNIGVSSPVAIYYNDGTLAFQDSDIVDASHGSVIKTYTDYNYSIASAPPWFDNRANINNIIINTIASPISTRYWFHSCAKVISLDLSNFDTSNVTDMFGMFYNCKALTSLNLSNFNTSNVTNMSNMFNLCSSLKSLDLSSFNTSNVTDMDYMFNGCSSLTSLDLSSFNTSNVTRMDLMFKDCSSLTSLDLSSFDMSNVTTTSDMFQGCTNLQTIYVKDETAKTKIEASNGFPTGATVIIGKPN